MASNNTEEKITLKYWVDNGEKRVIMAETNGEFVDILFSFLSLPLGTIHHLGNLYGQPVEMGCINNLHQSVKDMSSDVFWSNICQEMFRSPRNPLEESCRRLKVKVDATPRTKYFMCHSCSKASVLKVSSFAGARCSCGKLMRKEVELAVEEPKKEESGVFVKGDAMFLIFDNLRVLRSTPSDSLQPLLKHRVKDLNMVKEKSQIVGPTEIFSILKQALTSKSPLSDVLLGNIQSKRCCSFPSRFIPSHLKGSVDIKVIVSKSQNKILFAEADGEFVDFLASFLTTPLGSILKLMKGKLALGSIRKLYKSVKRLDPSWFIGSSYESLLNPKVAPQFGCKNNPLYVAEEDTAPKYWYGTVATGVGKDNTGRMMISKKKDMLQDPKELELFDPRLCDGAKKSVVGFMKKPCIFIVMDDLKVIPMTTTSSISYLLEQQNKKLNDYEEHFVKIRNSHEALSLMRASLTYKEAALTQSLCCLLAKWKCQRWIPFGSVLERKKKRPRKKREQVAKEREVTSDTRNREREKKEKKKEKKNEKKNEKNENNEKKKEDGGENKPVLPKPAEKPNEEKKT